MDLILIFLYILLFFVSLPLIKFFCGIFLLLFYRIIAGLEELF